MSEHWLSLIEEERVAERGLRHVAWFFRRGRAWVRVSEWPGVAVQRLPVGPGTVWQSQFELLTAEGTHWMCVESQPLTMRPRSAFEHLSVPRKTQPRHTVRNYYVVDSRGKLRLEKAWPSR